MQFQLTRETLRASDGVTGKDAPLSDYEPLSTLFILNVGQLLTDKPGVFQIQGARGILVCQADSVDEKLDFCRLFQDAKVFAATDPSQMQPSLRSSSSLNSLHET